VKTSSGKVVDISFLYLTVHRRIAGDVPIYLQFALKVTHPSENADFDTFRLIVPQPWQLVKKVKLSLICSRQCAFNRSSSHRWTLALPLSPQKNGSKRNFYIFCDAFHIFVAGNCRPFKFGMPIDHSKFQPMDDKLSLRWAQSRRMIHFKFQGHKHIPHE